MRSFLPLAPKRKKKEKHRKRDEGGSMKPNKKQKKSVDRPQDAETEMQANREETGKQKEKRVENFGKINDKKSRKKNKQEVITDERFAALHYDPRFQRMPKKEAKVVVDSRFSRMFTDENFAPTSAPVDKRGRRRKEKGVNPLLDYYLRDEEEEENLGVLGNEEETGGEESEKLESGDDESSSTDEDEDDDDQYSVDSDICHYLMADHNDTPLIENETHRLAVVNMDWDHIKAVDLYVVMSSCIPNGGQILSVAVYPSEFGLKCMEIEAVKGPSALIDAKEVESDDEAEINNERLRMYELNRLRYYYAVVVCDSNATANHIYRTLDGTELLKTSNVFDLRFIPDSMEFKHSPRDMTTEAPSSYKVPEFETRALQHSKVKLSWEEDEPERKKILRRKFNPNELDEFREYLASTDEDSDEEEDEHGTGENGEASGLPKGEAKRRSASEKLRALLQSADVSDSDKSDDKDMEITFNTGLEDLSKRILEKRDKSSETVWEAVLRKRKEKKAARRRRSKYASDEDDSSDLDPRDSPKQPEDFFEEPSDADTKANKKSSKDSSIKGAKSKNKDRELTLELVKEQEASTAELELLFAEDEGADRGPKGYNLKPKKVKGKRGKQEEVTEDKLPAVDYCDDPRFSALFTNPLYALDPTDPQYKRTAPYGQHKQQKQRRHATEETMKTTEEPSAAFSQKVPGDNEDSLLLSEKEKHEFSAIVRSLKRNVGTSKK